MELNSSALLVHNLFKEPGFGIVILYHNSNDNSNSYNSTSNNNDSNSYNSPSNDNSNSDSDRMSPSCTPSSSGKYNYW